VESVCETADATECCGEAVDRVPESRKAAELAADNPVIREISLKTGTPVGSLLANLLKCAGRT